MNVFTGGNGAGKTSLLEAIFALGLARSFRATDNRVLIRTGAAAARVSGQVSTAAGSVPLGVEFAPGGVTIRVAGRPATSSAELAEVLPIQILHAEVGGIVQGPPEPRRRLLDWGVFHVKHGYLSRWREFRRALLQRNAILREGGSDDLLTAWEAELATSALSVHEERKSYMERLQPVFHALGRRLLDAPTALRYSRGWPEDEDLVVALRQSREGDRAAGYTRVGPQRADLQFEMDETRSRWRASKGQQKLLAAAAILAQADLVTRDRAQPVALLVDEPAADLDAARLGELMAAIAECDAQVFIAAISSAGLPLPDAPAMFHVEHGEAKALL